MTNSVNILTLFFKRVYVNWFTVNQWPEGTFRFTCPRIAKTQGQKELRLRYIYALKTHSDQLLKKGDGAQVNYKIRKRGYLWQVVYLDERTGGSFPCKKNRNSKRILHFHTGGQRVGAYINQTHIIVVGDWRGGGWVE